MRRKKTLTQNNLKKEEIIIFSQMFLTECADNNDISGLELFNTLIHSVIYEQCLCSLRLEAS